MLFRWQKSCSSFQNPKPMPGILFVLIESVHRKVECIIAYIKISTQIRIQNWKIECDDISDKANHIVKLFMYKMIFIHNLNNKHNCREKFAL